MDEWMKLLRVVVERPPPQETLQVSGGGVAGLQFF